MIKLEQTVKIFNNHVVLDNINLSFQKGKIHGIVGDNGAGKTVLVHILSGVLVPDSGNYYYNGALCQFTHPQQAIDAGIATIHQDTHIVEELSVAENIFLGFTGYSRYKIFISLKKMVNDCKNILELLNINVDPKQSVKTLNLGQKQIIKVIKALLLEPKVLIMDEPFTNLSQDEIRIFNTIITEMQQKGMTIIYISHDIDDILEQCDTVTVLRDGKVIHQMSKEQRKDTSIHELMQLGTDFQYPRIPFQQGRKILVCENLTTNTGIEDVSFVIQKGEILGISGKLSSGKSGIFRAILGIDPLVKGKITLDGENFIPSSPQQVFTHRMGYLPEDISKDWLHESLSIPQNLTLSNISAIHKPFKLNKEEEKNITRRYINSLKIKTTRLEENISNLSGGNKQKIAIAKLLFTNSRILILDEPTKHLDSSTKIEVYNLINKCIGEGASIVFISTDLKELQGMCDRILIMEKGAIKSRLIRSPNIYGEESSWINDKFWNKRLDKNL